jgi:photosystem II stability/assembly factor-like uncharacterized protein
MKNFSFLLLSFLISQVIYPQENLNQSLIDTTKPVQYRRGIELQPSYQSYDEKYFGKNLSEEKRSKFPLESTGIWTELNPKVPRVDYIGIHFVNKDTGWACGDLGAIIKTTNGGSSWTVSQTNTTIPILKVRSYNGQVVIASGYGGTILRSIDEGENFTQVISNVSGDLWGLQIINDTLGWACGTSNSLIKTTDGGQSWQIVITPGYTGSLWATEFLNGNYGFIAGDGKVLRTTNGGVNWEIIQAGDSYPLYSIDIIDSLHIAAAGYGGTSYRGKNIYSSDAGSTWVDGGPLTFEAVNCIQYLNPDTGYIVMSEVGLWKTTNHGQNWIIMDTTGLGGIGEYELQFFVKENIGYNVGSSTKIYKTKGNLDIWSLLIIKDDFFDVYFTTDKTGFIVSGSLYKSINGGESWQKIENGPGGYDILFTDTLTGFIANNNSSIYKTTDGGGSWYLTYVPGDIGNVRKIFFVNQTIGWAATYWSPTSNSKILKTTDAGENWFVQVEDGTDPFTSIFFIDSLNGWATSRYVWQTTDGGLNWIQRTDIPAFFSQDVFSIGLSVFVIDNLTLYKSTNNGINWFIQFNSPYIIKNFGWLTNEKGFIMGGSVVYETNDSGNTWNLINELTNVGLQKFQAPNSLIGFSVGRAGLIYKYTDTSIVPIELTSFHTDVNNDVVTLKWTTSTETNNLGFEVLRSSDNQNWNSLVFINGNGTTTLKNSYQFTDEVETAGIYYYKLKQIDYNGDFNYSDVIEVNIINPINFKITQNYPNPFNPETTIEYQVPFKTLINISLFDIKGEKIKELVDEEKQPGYYSIKLKGGNLSSGIYLYRLITGTGFTAVKKITLIK